MAEFGWLLKFTQGIPPWNKKNEKEPMLCIEAGYSEGNMDFLHF